MLPPLPNNSSLQFIFKDKVYFYHMRKCGGTSIRKTLEKICKEKELEFAVTEGYPLGRAAEFFPPLYQEFKNSILDNEEKFNQFTWITNLRDPVERVFSLYLQNTRNKNRKEYSVKQFMLERAYPLSKYSKKFWDITSNYYIRALMNIIGEVTINDFENAKKMLLRFDLIYILDKNRVVSNGNKLDFLPIPFLRKQDPKNYALIQEEMTELTSLVQEMNYWDIKLYEYFDNLSKPL